MQKNADRSQRIIFHIDVNSAFLSWSAVERLKQGETVDLRKIPAIVGGDQQSRHGIVLAKSLSAKAYGIYTSQPVAQAMRMCPNLTMVPPDHAMYERYSHAMMELLREFSPDLEQISIDECFLDFTPIAHLYPSAVAAAEQIKNKIRDTLGFTVNVGIAPNKLLAKMASDFEKPDKVHTLWLSEVPEKMWPMSVKDLYMVGRSSVKKLEDLGIRTIGELAAADPMVLKSHLKSHGQQMWEYANGIDDSPVQAEKAQVKGIGNSTTLREDARTLEDARKVLLSLTESVATRLRQAKKLAGTITVEIKYFDFTTASHQCRLYTPSDGSGKIYETACQLFEELWDQKPVRLLGLRATNLAEADEPVQLSLFDMPLPLQEAETKAVSPAGKADKTAELTGYAVREADNGAGAGGAKAEIKEVKEVPDKPVDLKQGLKGKEGSGAFLEDSKAQKQRKLDAAIDAIRKRYGSEAVVRGSLLHDEDMAYQKRKGIIGREKNNDQSTAR